MSNIAKKLEDGALIIETLTDPVYAVSRELREEILELLEKEKYQEVSIDLGAVKMLDSSGIGVLIATYNTLRAKKSTFSVTNASASIVALLKSMGLDNHFAIHGQEKVH